jgi:hypothetical protein
MLLLSSCLGGSSESSIDDWNLGNAQIASFVLTSDSVPGLSNVKFTIDQLNGKIYNIDSMPYGTVIIEKVFCNITFDEQSLGVATVLFESQSTGDSVIWTSSSDSIDFSAPVTITVTPFDGMSIKKYEAKLNIHQENPDTMVWHKYSGLIAGKIFMEMKVLPYDDSYYMYVIEKDIYRLYKSDTKNTDDWSEITLNGFPEKAVLSQIAEYDGDLYAISNDGTLFCCSAEHNSGEEQNWLIVDGVPSIKTLLGSLSDNIVTGRTSVLSGIALEGETLHFISINKNKEWEIGMAVPETFPVSGFGSIDYETMYHPRIIVAAGRDSNDKLSNNVWSTMDGLSWTLLTTNVAAFSPREGVSLFNYDNNLFIIGGIDNSGIALNDICYSKDQGINWVCEIKSDDTEESSSKYYYKMPTDYLSRGFASAIVDQNNYILLFGGKAGNDKNVFNDLWRGRINRLGYGKE